MSHARAAPSGGGTMRLGIMATTFARPTLQATLDALAACGVQSVQFDLACAGVPTLPAQIAPALCARVRDAFAVRGLTMEALSGTFNMIHPDSSERAEGLRRLRVLLDVCGALGATVVTLCTGTRDAHHMWRRHPDNDTPEAWTDLVASMREVVGAAYPSRYDTRRVARLRAGGPCGVQVERIGKAMMLSRPGTK